MAPAPRRTLRPGFLSFLSLLLLLYSGAGLAAADTPTIEVTYYGEIGCSHCDTFVEKTIPKVEQEHEVSIDVTTRDILSAEGYEACRERLAKMDRDFRIFPVLFIGNNGYQGNSAIDRGLEEELRYLATHGQFRPQVPQTMDGSLGGSAVATATEGFLPFLPILLAGLADGINPCAFATAVFLLSFLALVGRSKRQILATGLLFAATIFATYFAIGFGLLSVLREAMDAPLLRFCLRVVVSAGTAVFAVLAIRDGILIHQGKSSEAVLQLSARAKRRIHSVIRSRVRGGGLVFATIGLAFMVSILELACTGQLYLPTIAYLVQTGSTRPAEVAALGAYNLAFIIPLVIVVLAVYYGVSSRRIGTWFSRRAGTAKFAMGAVFALLGAAIWFV